jgi:hypothetical protein
MNLIETILDVDKTADYDSIIRCLDKATIILFYDGVYLVADDTYIYYFGSIKGSRNKSKLGVFVKTFRYLVEGKLFYSKDITPFKRKTTVIDSSKELYKWR